MYRMFGRESARAGSKGRAESVPTPRQAETLSASRPRAWERVPLDGKSVVSGVTLPSLIRFQPDVAHQPNSDWRGPSADPAATTALIHATPCRASRVTRSLTDSSPSPQEIDPIRSRASSGHCPKSRIQSSDHRREKLGNAVRSAREAGDAECCECARARLVADWMFAMTKDVVSYCHLVLQCAAGSATRPRVNQTRLVQSAPNPPNCIVGRNACRFIARSRHTPETESVPSDTRCDFLAAAFHEVRCGESRPGSRRITPGLIKIMPSVSTSHRG